VKRWFVVAMMLFALASCQFLQMDQEPDSGLKGYSPNAMETQRAACMARGGSFSKAGKSDGLICIETTRDAGKVCTSGTECDGQCLARSGTCSPLKPLFGCHEILADNGGRATICID